MTGRPRIQAVVFDLGETLIDESRTWGAVADELGVPRFTFMAVLGGLVASGRSHRETFGILGVPEPSALPPLRSEDLYPDARPCLAAIRAMGIRVGIAANQPDRADEIRRILGLELDLVATSAAWGITKPSPTFFARIAEELSLPPAAIAYVGDRVDNDIVPAAAAGMCAIFLRRGPWAWIACPVGTPADASYTVEDLGAVPEIIRSLV